MINDKYQYRKAKDKLYKACYFLPTPIALAIFKSTYANVKAYEIINHVPAGVCFDIYM